LALSPGTSLGLRLGTMPKPDKLTTIRADNDLLDEAPEMAAWLYAEQFCPTPQLVFAAIEQARQIVEGSTLDWFRLKARTDIPCD
jgi:hypothetical protein